MKILANDGIESTAEQQLIAAGFTVSTTKIPQDQLAIGLQEYDILLVRSDTKVRQSLIDQCTHLKAIGRGGVGMDNIDVDYAREKGIFVFNTPAASSRAVAECAFAHCLTLSRSLHQSNRALVQSDKELFNQLKKQFSKGQEIRNKTMGIIGLGRIGKELAALALGGGMQVIAYDPFVPEAQIQLSIQGHAPISIPLTTTTLENVCRNSDYISVHIPSLDKPILGPAEMQWMKKGVILINTARGGVIDEAALLAGLNSGHIQAAGLDVFEGEPLVNPDLLNHPRISVSPHIGASTVEAQLAIGAEIVEILVGRFKS